MWFGTRDYMQWVKCHDVDVPSSKVGWSSRADYLNGGAYVRRSTAAHKEYTLAWNHSTLDDIRPILDYADKLYGDGPIYWLDPSIANKNVLPQWFASPFQGLDDGPILTGVTTRGEVITTPANTLGYPTKSIRYTMSGTVAQRLRVWVPIPPGYTAWVGVHGQDEDGGALVVNPTTGPNTSGPNTVLTMLGVTDETRVNTAFDSTDCDGILIRVGGSSGQSFILSGVIVQVLPTGTTPATGGFISGQGHSGCSFAEQPEYTPYSAAFGTGGLVADLIETEGWRTG
jgi:hypothetical protein